MQKICIYLTKFSKSNKFISLLIQESLQPSSSIRTSLFLFAKFTPEHTKYKLLKLKIKVLKTARGKRHFIYWEGSNDKNNSLLIRNTVARKKWNIFKGLKEKMTTQNSICRDFQKWKQNSHFQYTKVERIFHHQICTIRNDKRFSGWKQ